MAEGEVASIEEAASGDTPVESESPPERATAGIRRVADMNRDELVSLIPRDPAASVFYSDGSRITKQYLFQPPLNDITRPLAEEWVEAAERDRRRMNEYCVRVIERGELPAFSSMQQASMHRAEENITPFAITEHRGSYYVVGLSDHLATPEQSARAREMRKLRQRLAAAGVQVHGAMGFEAPAGR